MGLDHFLLLSTLSLHIHHQDIVMNEYVINKDKYNNLDDLKKIESLEHDSGAS